MFIVPEYHLISTNIVVNITWLIYQQHFFVKHDINADMRLIKHYKYEKD